MAPHTRETSTLPTTAPTPYPALIAAGWKPRMPRVFGHIAKISPAGTVQCLKSTFLNGAQIINALYELARGTGWEIKP
jgi:hypothetical protein